jgi:hypothetical protein
MSNRPVKPGLVPQDVIDAVSDADTLLPKYTQGLLQCLTPEAARRAAETALAGLESDLALYKEGALALASKRNPRRTPESVRRAVELLRAFLAV